MTTPHTTQRWNRGIATALTVALFGCLGYAALCWVAFSQGNQAIGHGFISDGAIYRRADVLYAYRLGVGRFIRSEYGMTPLMLAMGSLSHPSRRPHAVSGVAV